LLKALEPYLSYETEGWKKVQAGTLFPSQILLQALGLVKDGKVELTLEGPTGVFTLPFEFAPLDTKLIPLHVPFARKKPEEPYYWSEFLADSKTLYIQYNQCADDPRLPFKEFVAKTLTQAGESGAQRVVVDLRFNTGGNSRIINPLVDGLNARRKTLGNPYVLVGPMTFSSGVWGADDLRKKANAKLVGSPTGGLRGGYGESPTRELSNSKLRFQFTLKSYGSARELLPDIPVAQTLGDFRSGRDTVLEAALSANR
jgi:hypothetical protein